MASFSELASIDSALILHDDEVTVMEDKTKALLMLAKASADVNIKSLTCKIGTPGSTPAADAGPAGVPAPSTMASPPEEKEAEPKEEESEEADDDMGFGLFD
ncbi:unnamed protein product [Nyctereutes procyonoides]|uniref:(raccoon dog) hypothetical protein n=1 Tax=Nyctereutes procyonoides TaxID=34880 RepID=A0A811XZH1_NYCPR|nr:unnamed protein product [Nyctereutes procyonoides]